MCLSSRLMPLSLIALVTFLVLVPALSSVRRIVDTRAGCRIWKTVWSSLRAPTAACRIMSSSSSPPMPMYLGTAPIHPLTWQAHPSAPGLPLPEATCPGSKALAWCQRTEELPSYSWQAHWLSLQVIKYAQGLFLSSDTGKSLEQLGMSQEEHGSLSWPVSLLEF